MHLFTDDEKILSKLTEKGNPLERLDAVMDWQLFLPLLSELFSRKNKVIGRGGRPHLDYLMMFKVLLLQRLQALCQLQWVDEKLTPREDELRSLFLYVQSNQNPFFKVFKVPETKGISLNDFDEIIGSFQFGVRIR